MARRSKKRSSGFTILLVDDDPEYAQTTRMLLEREGHAVLWASCGPDGLAVLREKHADLVLLDYIMPNMTGEEVVKELRTFNDHVQVVLQTGYATENPPRELLRRLDIQGYHDKSEGPDKLLIWVDVGLRAAFAMQMLRKSREGLRYILSVTPNLHKIQPLVELLQGIILQVTGLVGGHNSFLATIPHEDSSADAPEKVEEASPGGTAGFVALPHDEQGLVICASTGRFSLQASVADCVDEDSQAVIYRTIQQQATQISDNATVLPLSVGSEVVGVVYLDRVIETQSDIELLQIFANQAAAAIHSARLLEMATLDPLTGVHLRRLYEQLIMRELRASFRLQKPLSFLLVDLDELKRINDVGGHLAGDQALTTIGKVLRNAIRDTDIAGRYGGDEFALFLPQADLKGAQLVGHRILEALDGATIESSAGEFPVKASIGAATLMPHNYEAPNVPRPIPKDYFDNVLRKLIEHTDTALYRAKKGGRNQMVCAEPMHWPPIEIGDPTKT